MISINKSSKTKHTKP